MNFRIIKSIEGEVNQPVFVKLLTKQYNIFFFLQISNYVFWQFDNISSLFDENRPVALWPGILMKYF